MIPRPMIILCLIGFALLFALNLFPYIWTPNPSTFINQDAVSGMAVEHNGLLYTLNFEQQKETIAILNRSIPVGPVQATPQDAPLDIQRIVIYRYDDPEVVISPVAWINKSLVFSAPDWSKGNLMEVSRETFYNLIYDSYDH